MLELSDESRDDSLALLLVVARARGSRSSEGFVGSHRCLGSRVRVEETEIINGEVGVGSFIEFGDGVEDSHSFFVVSFGEKVFGSASKKDRLGLKMVRKLEIYNSRLVESESEESKEEDTESESSESEGEIPPSHV